MQASAVWTASLHFSRPDEGFDSPFFDGIKGP
jgi:hypothetical protein